MSSTTELEDGEIENSANSTDEIPQVFYDKKKSFFDSISCEATEKSKQTRPNRDPKAEYKLNKETFGVAGNRGGRGYYNRRGGYYNNRGYGGKI